MKHISCCNVANTLCRGRHEFLNRINDIIPDIERKSTSKSIKLHMNSNDYHVNKLVMKFISLCMNIRDTLSLASESDVT